MTSLHRRLLTRLLAGLGLLWIAGGAAIYVTVRASLTGKFDAELRAMATEVRHLIPEGRLLRAPVSSSYAFDFFQVDSGLYFEVWDEYLLFSDRSPNLMERSLPQPAGFDPAPRVWNFTLETGERVRGLAQQFVLPVIGDGTAGSGDAVVNVLVARNRDSLDRSLTLLLSALGFAGILLIPLSVLITRTAVGRGLQPLHALSDRMATVGMDSLDERIGSTGMPAELVPICRRLDELIQRLKDGVERERRLNADLAHELRTPVAELKSMAEVALAWPDKIRAEHYREVLGAAQQMQTVIEGMLLLARWERSTERPRCEPVSIPAIVDISWLPHARAAAAKSITLRREIRPDETLQTNAELFQIILTNLLSNAVEYSPSGAEVVIACAPVNGSFRLSIANPAGDLKRADLPRLFDRFWRLNDARSGTGHAGLGLALAKTCAGVLSLDLSAELDEPGGTIVFILTQKTPDVKAARGD